MSKKIVATKNIHAPATNNMEEMASNNSDTSLISAADSITPAQSADELNDEKPTVQIANQSLGKLSPKHPLKSTANDSTPQEPFSIASLRLKKLGYGVDTDVKKLLVTVPVDKPRSDTFFMVRDGEDWVFEAFILTHSAEKEKYIVSEEIAIVLQGLVREMILYLSVDRNGNPTLIDIPYPSDNGKLNTWNESKRVAIQEAKSYWIRMISDKPTQSYRVYRSIHIKDKPLWPEQSMEELVEIAFRGKIITSIDHPIIQGLLGLI